MIILGLILLILGLFLGIPLLYYIGGVLLIVGLILIFVRPGGRIYY